MTAILFYILLASGLHSTTYGWGGNFCGDIGEPVPCVKGLYTASGEIFDPEQPTAAVFTPTKLVMRPRVVPMRLDGKCKYVRVNDKGSPRFIGERGFDLTPAAIKLLGGVPTSHWSGKVTVCKELMGKFITKLGVLQWNIR